MNPAVKTILSPEITLTVACEPRIVTISPPDLEFESIYLIKGNTANNTISFSPFTCDFSDCCQWTDDSYQLVDATSLLPLLDSQATCCESLDDGDSAFEIDVSTI